MRYLSIAALLLLAACAGAPEPGPTPAPGHETSPSPVPRPDSSPRRGPEPQFPSGVPWGSSLDAARSQAAEQNKRLFIEFSGEG